VRTARRAAGGRCAPMDPDRLTWVGHSTVALDLGGTRLLTDPVLRGSLLHLRRHGPLPDPALLRHVDAVLISHLHLDHLDLPSLRMLGTAVRVLVPRGGGALLSRRGFREVTEMAEGDSAGIGTVRVTAVAAEHDERRLPGGPTAAPLGFVVEGRRRVYFAGDTALFGDMSRLGDGGLDVALLPVWGWGPKLGEGHMDPDEAARACVLLRPAIAVPIHWGTFFPRGLAPLRGGSLVDPPHAFVKAVRERCPGVDARVLRPGAALLLGEG
jgi:L-ascorbate metabolism protein UlaG (beta-lactamase superfamily)